MHYVMHYVCTRRASCCYETSRCSANLDPNSNPDPLPCYETNSCSANLDPNPNPNPYTLLRDQQVLR